MRSISKTDSAIPRHLEDDDLISYLDGELLPDEQLQARLHLESCWICRSRLNVTQRSVENFVRLRQDTLSPGKLPPADPVLDLFRHRLSAHIRASQPQPRFGLDFARLRSTLTSCVRFYEAHQTLWRRGAVTAFTLVLLAVIAWLWTGARSTVSADEIFNESRLRERAWTYQPSKVLHWVVESDFTNHPFFPDGRYVAHYWQNNYPGQAARLNRLYDQKGVLVSAIWDKPDGSSVIFKHVPDDEVQILPPIASQLDAMKKILREGADKLEPGSRQRLEALVKHQENHNSDDLSRNFEAEVGYLRRSLDNAKLEVVSTPAVGKTFRIRDEFTDRTLLGIAIRGVIERDIAADTLRRFRLKSTRYLPDGKTAVQDSRWTLFEETSIADLEAHDLRDVIASAKRVICLTPEERLQGFIHYKRQGKEKTN